MLSTLSTPLTNGLGMNQIAEALKIPLTERNKPSGVEMDLD